MDIEKALIEAVSSVMNRFGMNSKFITSSTDEVLSSANQVNVLLSITGGLKGNILYGFKKTTALKIASAMMGGYKLNEFNDIAKSALGEIANIMTGSFLINLDSPVLIDESPPTVITGDNMFIFVSLVKSKRFLFKLDSDFFNIAICVEKGI